MPRGQSPQLTAGRVASLAIESVARLATDNRIAVVVIAVSADGQRETCHVRTNLAGGEVIDTILSVAAETIARPDLMGKSQLSEQV